MLIILKSVQPVTTNNTVQYSVILNIIINLIIDLIYERKIRY